MSVIVLVENIEGAFKKKSFELVQYASNIAQSLNTTATALVLGSASNEEMTALGAYGANKVLHVNDAQLNSFSAKAYTKAVQQAVQAESATVVVAANDVIGKSIAPMIASRLKAGLVAGAVSYPDLSNGFVIKRNVFAGKAFAFVNITTPIKVITLLANTFAVTKNEGTATIENLSVSFDAKDFALKVSSVNKVSGSVPLSEAELVVSGGRGLKGPENWGVIEDLAATLGAATACSRPVADSHWRPHHEHVGQTGGTIRPNLYIAIGISGAIQHLAGVNGSKTIVVINKDPEAPFFKAADYGVIGDALEITPKLNEAFKKFKASQA
jgi:electron transfer flavoprotein alpha subunit